VPEPGDAHAGLSAGQRAKLRAQELADAPRRAEHQAPRQRLLGLQQRTADRVESGRHFRRQVKRLRVVDRVGQALVAMVDEVRAAIAQEWQP
jgi:hypothetical protein